MNDRKNSSSGWNGGTAPRFTIGPGVTRGAGWGPYECKPGDPLYRRLRIYTVDPGTRQEEGAVAVVNVPYEELEKDRTGNGWKGRIFHVLPVLVNCADEEDDSEHSIDLDEPRRLLTDGCTPSPVDSRFHQQMVYAVASLVSASFRRALGRHVAWGFDAPGGDPEPPRLRLRPHGRRGHAGATYNRNGREIMFGFVQTESEPRGRAAPNGHSFSCVSHDIVAHEVTHALLDGLRAHFLEPTSADVLGFHEGLADLVALLHRYSYKELVRTAIRGAHGRALRSQLLTTIAKEFGLNVGNGGALRNVEVSEDPRANAGHAGIPMYREDLGPHEMGRVFVSAVLHAFATVHARKIERYLRLASGGTGVLPPGDLSADLQEVLVEEVTQLANQFLNVCIRALDYCPPVDLQLGEFLRAVITADLDLVPDDPWGYREAWIDAFAKHGIFPRGVQSMSEDALRWPFFPSTREAANTGENDAPAEPEKVDALSFAVLEFNGDPARAASACELRRRADELGRFVTQSPENMELFGILSRKDERLDSNDGEPPDVVDPPEVHSVRTSRRVGPDGQVVFDLVAEVTQTRWVADGRFLFRGGCTVILGPQGELRYVIRKSVGQNSRVFRQRKFMQGAGREFVTTLEGGWNAPDAETLQFIHQHDD